MLSCRKFCDPAQILHVFCLFVDAPYVIDGRTEYYMTVEEKIEIVLGVYTNVEPLIVTVERNSDVVGRTAIWMIGKTQETVVIPVYNYDLFTQGYKIVINFQVQAEKNYGAYRILLRNDVGSTAHNFTIMSRGNLRPSLHQGDLIYIYVILFYR